MKYYLRRKEKVIGPLSPRQLAEGVRTHKFLATDEISVSPTEGFTILKDVLNQAVKGEWIGVDDGLANFAIGANVDSSFWEEAIPASDPNAHNVPMTPQTQTGTDLYGSTKLLKQIEDEERLARKEQDEESLKDRRTHWIFGGIIAAVCLIGIPAIYMAARQPWNEVFGNGSVASTSPNSNAGKLKAGIARKLGRYTANRSYESEIDLVLQNMRSGDTNANSALQQCANGAYRLFEMLSIIAGQLDIDDNSQGEILTLGSMMSTNNSRAKSAPQQTVNGIYRSVEALVIAAKEVDSNSNFSADIGRISFALTTSNELAKSAEQQNANGSYRLAEMLEILCKITDKKNEFTSEISQIGLEMSLGDSSTKSAMQQSANGLYASCRLMAIFAKIVDPKSKYRAEIDQELSNIKFNTTVSSETAYQQMATCFYGLTRLAALAARGLNP